MLLHPSLLVTLAFSVISTTNGSPTTENTTTPIDCPTWYRPSEEDPSDCVCGSTLDGKVRCQQSERVSLVVGNCMTYTDSEVLTGLCPYAVHNGSLLDNLYTTLPERVSELDDFMCGGLNRTGLLCSKCVDRLSLAAMSYQRECVECSNEKAGIVLFLFLVFVPATLFFLLIMVCGVDISSGPMNAALTLLQVNLAQVNQNPADYIFKSSNPLSYYFVVFLVTFYGIWNLDFLRYVIPPFCISNSLTSLQAQGLEYVIAVYPLLLIALTYTGVEMYDGENSVAIKLWQPFKKIFSMKYFKGLNVKYSLIATFATFLQLVYTRLFFISKEILNYAELKNSAGDTVSVVLAMDASVTYSSTEHVPYIVLAVMMLLIFNLLPLILLLLYSTRCFQRFLGRFPRVNWHPLHAFMDIFHGCYKNGTSGTKDCRYFAALNLMVRIMMLAPIDNHSLSSLNLVIVPLLFTVLLATQKPYQKNILNLWGIFCYFLCTLNQLWVLCSTYDTHLPFELVYISHIILFSYFCFLIVGKTVKTISPGCYRACLGKVARCAGKIGCRQIDNTMMADLEANMRPPCEEDEEFPDRVNNHQDYRPLLAKSGSNSETTVCHNIASYGVI